MGGEKEEKQGKVSRYFGVRKRLMAVILPVVAVALALLILIAFYTSKASMKEKTENLMDATGTSSVNRIASWESSNLTALETAVDSMVYLKMKDDEILNYEAQFLGTYSDFPNGVYLAYEDGKVLDASGWEPEGDVTQSGWYQEGMGHDTFTFGEPYQDALTGDYVVTASRKVPDLNGKTAVVAADVSLSILSDVVSNMEVAANGDAFIIDGVSGTILAHKDEELVGKTAQECGDSFYQEIQKDISNGNIAKTNYDSKDGSYMVKIQNIDGTNWYIVSRGLEKYIYEDVTKLRVKLAVVAMQIKNLAENSADAAGEISELIDSVTGLIKETVSRSEQSAEQINQSADTVFAAAEQFDHIYESIEHTNKIVHEMIEKIRDVNDVASNMAAITEEQSASAEEIEATAVNIQELADTVSENSADVHEDSNELAMTADTLKQHISQFII